MHRSRLVSALVDVPADLYQPAARFWASALGREGRTDEEDPDYVDLGEVTPGFRMMVQRVDAPVRVHLDIETDDIDAEVTRLELLGAAKLPQVETWWEMRDPAGLLFCVVRVQLSDAFERYATTWP
jgi:Glyoxalase-like domain